MNRTVLKMLTILAKFMIVNYYKWKAKKRRSSDMAQLSTN